MNEDAITVLHVDDDRDFADLAGTFLERENERLTVEAVTSASEGKERFDEEEFDCVISDYDMPGETGIEFLREIREKYPDVPFILFTGKGSEEVASEAISAGVTDYLQKETGPDQYTVLANRVANAVEHYRSQQIAERSEQRLREIIDALPHILYVIDEDGTYILANEALADFHGTTVDAIEGARLEAYLDGAEAKRVREDHHEVLESDSRKQGTELRVTDSTGEEHVIEPEMLPYKFTDTDSRAVLGVGEDITERRERERTLEQTRERMQFALEHTSSIIFEINFGSEADVNHGNYRQFFGVTHPEANPSLEHHIDRAVHPADQETFRRFYEELWTGDRDSGVIEFRTSPAHGDVRWIRDDVYTKGKPETDSRQAIGLARDVTEQKEHELELQRKERRYQAIFNDPNILVGLLDTDGKVLDINETAMEFIDATQDEVSGKPFWDTPWFDHSAVVQRDVEQWIEQAVNGKYVEFEVELVRPDGEPYCIEGVFRPVRNDNGDVVSLIVSDRDITAQKERERERELEQTNALLSTLFDALPVGVLAEDGSRDVLAVNQQMFDELGLPGTPEAMLGSDCERLAKKASAIYADPDGFIERVSELVAEREPVRNEEFALQDGQTVAQSYHPIELEGKDGHLWVYYDITERKRHEHRLEILNESTRTLMTAQSREAVTQTGVDAASEVLDLDANSIHLHKEDQPGLVPAAQSDSSYDIVGEPPILTREDSIGWRIFERGEAVSIDNIHDDPDVLNTDSPFQSELYLPLGDHGLLIAGATTTGAFDQQDLVLGEILAGNITAALDQVEQTEQLRAREQELTQQNDRLEEFASIVSHDLRNPLNVAGGRLELAMEECESEQLEKISDALDRMENLIDDLLKLAREGNQIQEQKPVALADIASNCWENVDTARATLTSDTAKTIQADRNGLKRLFENLYRNAVEHCGDEVTVTVTDIEGGFVVEDDGPGIPPAKRQTVFDAGYSSSTDGTGYGLNIVTQIVDAHGWESAVTESDSGGARFEITHVETRD